MTKFIAALRNFTKSNFLA